MFEQIVRHKYFFHIVAIIVILTATILFIVFSGNSAETEDTPPAEGIAYIADIQEPVKVSEAPDIKDPPPSAHWSDEEPGWGTENQNE